MSRRITPAEAAEQGEVIYQIGWPRRWGLFRMCCVVVWTAAVCVALWVRPTAASNPSASQTNLLVLLGFVLANVSALLGDDTVTITGTAVRRRSHLSTLLRRGFRAVELAPNSWFVRSKYSDTRVLWVGSRPHSSPQQDILTMKLGFQDDPKALTAALTAVGVEIQDEHGEWLLRRPILARLEMALPAAYLVLILIWLLTGANIEVFAGSSLLALAVLAVVHWKAR